MKQKLRAIAVDDEKHCLDTLVWELQRYCPEVELVNQIQNVEEALQILPDSDIDVLFLDIHLQSMTGLELLERIFPVYFQVIFITAYDEYALKAFDLAATHYLLKPINGKKLKAAVQRVWASKDRSITAEALAMMVSTWKSELQKFNKVPFAVQNGIEFIDPSKIIYIEGQSNYSILYLEDAAKLVISKTLAHTEEILIPFSFLRIHKSYLINLKYLRKYIKSDGHIVELENGVKLPVSRLRRKVLNTLLSS